MLMAAARRLTVCKGVGIQWNVLVSAFLFRSSLAAWVHVGSKKSVKECKGMLAVPGELLYEVVVHCSLAACVPVTSLKIVTVCSGMLSVSCGRLEKVMCLLHS
jgi:hypothetical protein